MRATIRDVAKAAGVSVSTVSYALSRKGTVVKETHKRVLAAAEKLGYVPDAKARSLVHNRTNSIGLILPGSNTGYDEDVYDPFYAGVISVFADELAKIGNWCNLCLFSENDSALREYLTDAAVDGFIWYAVPGKVNELVNTISVRRGLPRIGVFSLAAESGMDIADVPRVIINEGKMVAEAAEHLISQGHTRILCISSREWDPRTDDFLHTLKANGLQYSQVIYGEYSEARAYEKMTELIKSSEALPTAVFATSDYMAIGAVRAIRDAGLSVPNDISVVGYDDIILSRSVTPPLTTCRHDTGAIAKATIEYIAKCRDNRETGEVIRTEVSGKLILRDSVAPPKSK